MVERWLDLHWFHWRYMNDVEASAESITVAESRDLPVSEDQSIS
jgi:hypothetical protein